MVYVRPRFAGYAVGKAIEDVVREVELPIGELEKALEELNVVPVVKVVALEIAADVVAGLDAVVDGEKREIVEEEDRVLGNVV